MINDKFVPVSEETAVKLGDAIDKTTKTFVEFADGIQGVMRQMCQLHYVEAHIAMILAQDQERYFASQMAGSFFLRPYYLRKYRKARRERIYCQRAMIHARIINAEDHDIITEFDKIDRMHV